MHSLIKSMRPQGERFVSETDSTTHTTSPRADAHPPHVRAAPPSRVPSVPYSRGPVRWALGAARACRGGTLQLQLKRERREARTTDVYCTVTDFRVSLYRAWTDDDDVKLPHVRAHPIARRSSHPIRVQVESGRVAWSSPGIEYGRPPSRSSVKN